MASGARNFKRTNASPAEERKDATAEERDALREAAANTPREVNGVAIPAGVFLNEGMREELERLGRTIDPLTGTKLGDWPDEQ